MILVKKEDKIERRLQIKTENSSVWSTEKWYIEYWIENRFENKWREITGWILEDME